MRQLAWASFGVTFTLDTPLLGLRLFDNRPFTAVLLALDPFQQNAAQHGQCQPGGDRPASQHLPPAQVAELLDTAKDPFTSGLNITGVIAAVIFGALAVLIATMRRTSDPRSPGRTAGNRMRRSLVMTIGQTLAQHTMRRHGRRWNRDGPPRQVAVYRNGRLVIDAARRCRRP